MKAREFLIEYNRDVTLRHFSDKMFKQWMTSPAYQQWLSANPAAESALTDPNVRDRLIKQMIDILEQNDPTPNKQYVPWMAREYSNGNIQRLEDVPSRVRPALEKFHRVKNTSAFTEYLTTAPWILDTFKGPMTKAKDINTIKWWMLEDLVSNFGEPEPDIKDKGESKVVFENEYVRVIVPLDQQAACYYGQGTRWCTAATKGENLFSTYSKQGILYIIIPKQKLKRPGEKYQLHPESRQFMNEKDHPVPLETLDDFPGLLAFFRKTEATNDLVEFQDPKVLEGINKICLDHLEEVSKNLMAEEASDDSEYQGILMQYAGDENGEIDWDKVEKNPVFRYENFNTKYNKLFSRIDDMKSRDAEQIKKAVKNYAAIDWADNQDIADWYTNFARTFVNSRTHFFIDRTHYRRGVPIIQHRPHHYEIAKVGPYLVLATKFVS